MKVTFPQKQNDLTLDLDHVLKNEGVYKIVGDNQNRRIVTWRSGLNLITFYFFVGGDFQRFEPISVTFWKGERFISANEKLKIVID
jgi:hypothetical protein